MTAESIALAGTILLADVGSRGYGLHTENSDRDLMGVCLEPTETVIGLGTFEQYQWRTQPQGKRSGPGDIDLTVYSARKFCALAAQGNPTILSLLFAKPQRLTTTGIELRGLADAFHSRRAVHRFLGYLSSQRQKMTGERSQRTNRPELIEAHGYDTKFGGAAVRLGVAGIEFATTGVITMPMPDPWNERIRAIRAGLIGYDECLAMIDELAAELETLADDTMIPPDPDRTAINSFLIDSHRLFWSGAISTTDPDMWAAIRGAA